MFSYLSNVGLGLATWQTVYMVYISSFIAIFFGAILGLVFVFTKQGKISKGLNPIINFIIGLIVNIVRSIPFIILLIAIIPFTRWLVGTSIGTNAAIVSLSIASIAFYARVAEGAFLGVSPGLIEVGNAMGASNWQLIFKIYLPEALPKLVQGATLTIIGLIGYSAMAGAIGGGGLGEVAYNLGYLRFQPSVILSTVIILVILVQLVQSFGDKISKRPKIKIISWTSLVLFVLCLGVNFGISYESKVDNSKVITIGVMAGIEGDAYKVAKSYAKKHYGLDFKFIDFDDYTLPNRALSDGDIDANIFQHVPYLKADVKAHGYKLTVVARTFNYPIGFYSKKIKNIKNISDLPNGALVGIASDPSNGGRELLLLQQAGLIKIKPKVGLLATPSDIIYNPKHLRFKLLEAAMLPRALNDMDLVAINTSFLKSVSLSLKDAVLKEGANSPYANVIVVRTKDKNKIWVKELIKSIHSKDVIKAEKKNFPGGSAVVAWG